MEKTLEKELELTFNKKWEMAISGKLQPRPEWLKPIPDYETGDYETDDYDNDKLEKALDRALITIETKRVHRFKLNEKKYFESFDNMIDTITNRNQIGVSNMNKENVLEIALELSKSGQISDSDLTKIESRLNKGIALESKWIKLIKGKLKKEDDDYEGSEDDEYEDEDEDDYSTEAEYGEEFEEDDENEYENEEEEKERIKKKKKKSNQVEYESDMKSQILSECTELCKSDKISLVELIRTEECVNKGLILPERVSNFLGIEYDDELSKADLVGYNPSFNQRQPTKGKDIATPGEEFGDESEFNNYFGLTQEEALDRLTDLHIDGKIDTLAVTKLEGRIRKNLPLPKAYEKFFKKGSWLH